MPHYISLLKFTQKGLEAIKESPARLEEAGKVFAAHGGSLQHAWYTTGQHDLIVVTEFPDEEAYSRALLATAYKGFVSGENIRAFTIEEMKKLLGV